MGQVNGGDIVFVSQVSQQSIGGLHFNSTVDSIYTLCTYSQGTDPRASPEITPQLLCDGCHATLIEVFKQLPPKRVRKESDIYDKVLDICAQENFEIYRAIPPTMAKACSEFLDVFDSHDEDVPRSSRSRGWTADDGSIEEQIYKAGTLPKAESKICPRFCSGRGVRWISPEEEMAMRTGKGSTNDAADSDVLSSSSLKRALDDAGISPEMHRDGTLKVFDRAKRTEEKVRLRELNKKKAKKRKTTKRKAKRGAKRRKYKNKQSSHRSSKAGKRTAGAHKADEL